MSPPIGLVWGGLACPWLGAQTPEWMDVGGESACLGSASPSVRGAAGAAAGAAPAPRRVNAGSSLERRVREREFVHTKRASTDHGSLDAASPVA